MLPRQLAFTVAEARLPTNSRLTRYLLYVYGQTMRMRELYCYFCCILITLCMCSLSLGVKILNQTLIVIWFLRQSARRKSRCVLAYVHKPQQYNNTIHVIIFSALVNFLTIRACRSFEFYSSTKYICNKIINPIDFVNGNVYIMLST